MSEDELDVIVVGAGLAGLACGWELSKAGLQVMVLERGDLAGAKNLSGGRLYLDPLHDLCGDLLDGAPFERTVVSESITLTDDHDSLTVRVDGPGQGAARRSVTVLRAKLDQFLADRLAEKEVLVLPQQRVEQLVREGGRVVGVKVGPEVLRAKMIVAADGCLSFLAEEAGLRPRREPQDYGVGVKELIELDPVRIEERFNVPSGSGAARLFMGRVTEGLLGGAFLYTNQSSLSLGLVVNADALVARRTERKLWELLEAFKARPDVAPLLEGGKTVEYGAHLIPEGGLDKVPALGIPGLLIIGDAAGMVINTGATVRGMDFALAAGVLAGRAIAQAKLDPEASLEHYKNALAQSFVMQQLRAHRRAPAVLGNGRLYDHYPPAVVQLARQMFAVGQDGASLSIGGAIKRLRKNVLGWRGYKDLWRLSRM